MNIIPALKGGTIQKSEIIEGKLPFQTASLAFPIGTIIDISIIPLNAIPSLNLHK